MSIDYQKYADIILAHAKQLSDDAHTCPELVEALCFAYDFLCNAATIPTDAECVKADVQ